jgi:Type VII secretion system ESX-1, transport TM domain B
MTTKRDLAEAHLFTRRRLVTALVSGSVDRHEAERAGSGRALAAGLALALVVLAAGATARVVLDPDVDGPVPGQTRSQDRAGRAG